MVDAGRYREKKDVQMVALAVELASAHVNLAQLSREETAPILILPNVKSVEDVHRHVLTTLSLI